MMIVEGDLLNNDCHMILQQLNCLCVKGKGLSKSVSEKYPYANVYILRRQQGSKNLAIEQDRSVPGTCVACFPPSDMKGPIVVGLYGQYDFGKPISRSYRPKYIVSETKVQREIWFKSSLTKLSNWIKSNNYNKSSFKIGIPYKIGCGLAGGNWGNYLAMIKDFASNINCTVIIYKLY